MIAIDMPMPKNCQNCPFKDDGHYRCEICGRSWDRGLEGRPSWCPLTEADDNEGTVRTLKESLRDGSWREGFPVRSSFPVELDEIGECEARVAAHNADARADGAGKAKMTCLLRLPDEWKHAMNPCLAKEDPADQELFLPGTGAVGGWEASDMRKWLDEKILPRFPEYLRDLIVPVRKVSRTFLRNCDICDVTTSDVLWIPSVREMFGLCRFGEHSGPSYAELFRDGAARASASWWWLRSADYASCFRRVYSDGSNNGNGETTSGGVVLGFCLDLES